MTKAELESKHLAELHALAAEADVPRYRMLRREELIEKLLDGKPAKREQSRGERSERSERRDRPERRERPPRQRRESPAKRERSQAGETTRRTVAEEATPESPPEPAPASQSAPAAEPSRPKRRRRRRFGRRSKALRVQDLLTPPPGRQALVYGEGREACTTLLREIAAGLADGSIALLVDPSPEELADWKRQAPQAELVVAAQARHASDALAQAARRAEAGEDVTLLVDSLTRLEDTEVAKEIFDGGLGVQANGSLTVVAALERSS